ncbi:glycoside hydrolase family 30 beta sandwich domain-containing protein [Paenibacillus sp. RC67]|uniref:glycoside hydrolase family 30 protein n=1 Tax=Paenibacillus sp. RC67 TaxID=3039392 RepID=UPI0024AE77A9|nr:glycoside hydrolase family 30 beta sandwich domain-containing protein [Paenibacillus sp. RC67]
MIKAEAWLTTHDLTKKLQSDSVQHLKRESEAGDHVYKININAAKTFQEMDGFGASFTDASAWLIHERLDEATRSEVMRKLFDRTEGIGMTFIRQPMGACDFNDEMYSYNELGPNETDYGLEHFTIEHDQRHIIPLLQEALRISRDIKIMASPWSPPGWMKTSGQMIGGRLKPECYGVYADYFVRFIHAYEREGITIYAVTPQNEPGYEPSQYPGMLMTAEEQIEFIRHLGPAFRRNHIFALIMCYDHNWDVMDYAQKVLGNSEINNYVAGSAWHCYGGKHEAMSVIQQQFPDKGIWFTEASGGEWIPPTQAAFLDQMKHVIRCSRNGSKSIVWWNIALDEKNGPTVLKKSTCRGLLRISRETGEVEYNLDYYTLGHISKFVIPGAMRIDSNTYEDQLETAAFRNPDGTIILIASNRTSDPKSVKVQVGSECFGYEIPGDSAATLQFKQVTNED